MVPSIRRASINDLHELQELFVNTIKKVCISDYNPAQIGAWIASVDNMERWKKRVSAQYFLVAELEGKIVGFGSLENNVYLDFLYVHAEHQHEGIGKLLYARIEAEARSHGIKLLTSDVSITAKPFFEKAGFEIETRQRIKIKDVELVNYKMVKILR